MAQQNNFDQGSVNTRKLPPLIFLGPTLPVDEARALLPGCFRPPARRGDIYRAVAEGYTTIVLIDGEFHGAPSVWQREIADALTEGVEIHGASSMGAIRAAELHPLGMIGHGRIFAWFRDGKLDADDEVALVYGPPERGYPAGSEPLVNIRATLEACESDIMSTDEADRAIEFMKGLYYPERSYDALLEKGPVASWPQERRRRLAVFLQEKRIDQKREDAIGTLAAVAAGGFKPSAPAGSGRVNRLWKRERLAAEGVTPQPEVSAAEIGKSGGLSEQELRILRRELSALFFVAEWAGEHNIKSTAADFERQETSFPAAAEIPAPRRRKLLAPRAQADAAIREFSGANGAADVETATRAIINCWASENGIEWNRLRGEALIDWIIEAGPGHFGYTWSFDIELAETLWLLGRAAGFPPQEVA